MNEILASIRRIIADDQAQGIAASNRGASPQPVAYASDPAPQPRQEARPDPRSEPRRPAPRAAFDGAPDMRLGEPERPLRAPKTFADAADLPPPPPPVMREPPPPRPFQAQRDTAVRAQAVASEPPLPLPRPPRGEGAEIAERLLSPQNNASVSTAFDTLASTAAAQIGQAPSMEDFVRDMLRPMLKTWLDENLPALVERLVRQEIERVARGPR